MGGVMSREKTATFAARLLHLREQAGLSMTDLAARAGMPLPVYSRLESGDREPSWKSLLKIATALHISLAEFDCCLR